MTFFPGVKTFLEEAKHKGIPCAIASASKNAPFILDKLGVMQDFDVIVDPATLSKGKPDPEIFIQAAKGLNIKPSDAVGLKMPKQVLMALRQLACMQLVSILVKNCMELTQSSKKKLTDLSIDELLAK